jgi:hypothetical protein
LNDRSCEPLANVAGPEDYSSREAGRPDDWEGNLADVPVVELPTDQPRPAILGRAMGVVSRSLGEEIGEGISRL